MLYVIIAVLEFTEYKHLYLKLNSVLIFNCFISFKTLWYWNSYIK